MQNIIRDENNGFRDKILPFYSVFISQNVIWTFHLYSFANSCQRSQFYFNFHDNAHIPIRLDCLFNKFLSLSLLINLKNSIRITAYKKPPENVLQQHRFNIIAAAIEEIQRRLFHIIHLHLCTEVSLLFCRRKKRFLGNISTPAGRGFPRFILYLLSFLSRPFNPYINIRSRDIWKFSGRIYIFPARA